MYRHSGCQSAVMLGTHTELTVNPARAALTSHVKAVMSQPDTGCTGGLWVTTRLQSAQLTRSVTADQAVVKL